MTTATLDTPAVLLFQARDKEFFPVDDNGGEALYYLGEILCPGCHRATPVSSQLGIPESGFCWACQSPIVVCVDPSHLRMDDSRPMVSGHGCVCGDPLCRWWEVA